MSEDPRPGTYASLEKRVGALEGAVAGIERDLRHQGELFSLRLDAIKATSEATKTAVHGIEDLIERALRGDDTVAPRAAEERKAWIEWRKTVEARLEAQEEQDARFAGMKASSLAVLAILGGLASVVSVVATLAKLGGLM